MKEAVLIIEDDKYLRRQIYWALKDEYRILEADDAVSARKIMDKSSPLDAVLLDLHLPPKPDTPEEGLKGNGSNCYDRE